MTPIVNSRVSGRHIRFLYDGAKPIGRLPSLLLSIEARPADQRLPRKFGKPDVLELNRPAPSMAPDAAPVDYLDRVSLEKPVAPKPPGGLFCVTLRSQPGDLAFSRQPLINIGLADEAFDVPNFSPGTVGFNLPIALGDALAGKGDAGGFFHPAYMDREPADS
jgi:hypothetical protein